MLGSKNKNTISGIIGFLLSITLVIVFPNLTMVLKEFGEKYISKDQIELGQIEFLLILLILLIIVISVFFFLNIFKKIWVYSELFISTNSAKEFFLKEHICKKKQLPKFLFISSGILGMLLHFYLLLFGQPAHEGIFETYSSLLFLIAGFILIISIIKINKSSYPPNIRKKTVLILLLLSVMLLFIFGEEISWGQRIFNWQSFGIFKDYNLQTEINAHNFFNPIFQFIYPAVGMSSYIFLSLIWFFPSKNRSYLFHLFIPPPSFLFLVFLMACSSFKGHSEVYEELLAIFFLLYSVRIFICLSNPIDKFILKRGEVFLAN